MRPIDKKKDHEPLTVKRCKRERFHKAVSTPGYSDLSPHGNVRHVDEGKMTRRGLFDSRHQEGRRIESRYGEKPDFEQAAITGIEIQKFTDVEAFVAVREPDGADPEKNEAVPHAEHTQENRIIPDFFR